MLAPCCIYIIHNYSGTDNKELSDSCDESQELFLLMKQKLPEYVAKCFLASGFDSEEAIASMDVTIDGPENAISVMEAYIEKHYPHDPSMHSEFSFGHGMPFEFPPGHKVRICSFVKAVKQNYNRKMSPIFNCITKPPTQAFMPGNRTTQQKKAKYQ